LFALFPPFHQAKVAQKKIDKYVLKYEKQQTEQAHAASDGAGAGAGAGAALSKKLPPLQKHLLDNEGRAITTWLQLQTAIEKGGDALELLLVHDATTEQRWKECAARPAPVVPKEAEADNKMKGEGEALPQYIAMLTGFQLLYALGEDGFDGTFYHIVVTAFLTMSFVLIYLLLVQACTPKLASGATSTSTTPIAIGLLT
jgi:hypothetical protein